MVKPKIVSIAILDLLEITLGTVKKASPQWDLFVLVFTRAMKVPRVVSGFVIESFLISDPKNK